MFTSSLASENICRHVVNFLIHESWTNVCKCNKKEENKDYIDWLYDGSSVIFKNNLLNPLLTTSWQSQNKYSIINVQRFFFPLGAFYTIKGFLGLHRLKNLFRKTFCLTAFPYRRRTIYKEFCRFIFSLQVDSTFQRVFRDIQRGKFLENSNKLKQTTVMKFQQSGRINEVHLWLFAH